MKPHSILLTAICLPLLLLVGACKPDKTKDPITITYKLGEVKDYMVFKPGTYWVYQNDITGEIDSQWVTSCQVGEYSQKGTEEYSRHITLKQEFFEMYIATNFIDGYGDNPRWKLYSWGNRVNAFPSPQRAYQIEKSKIANNTGGESTIYYNPYNLCSKKDCFYYFDTTYNDYELNGSTYDTVRVFHVGADRCGFQSKIPTADGKSDYYFAKNYGLIKLYNMSFKASNGTPINQTWSLIRKNIVQ
jgi:hypothetical protein